MESLRWRVHYLKVVDSAPVQADSRQDPHCHPDLFAMSLTDTAEPNVWKCGQCAQTFTQRVLLQMHVCSQEPNKPYQCGHCPASFQEAGELREHVVIHMNEKPFKCGYCGRSFSGATTLNNHIRTHTGEKPFKCARCGKTFTQSTQLSRHQKAPDECKGAWQGGLGPTWDQPRFLGLFERDLGTRSTWNATIVKEWIREIFGWLGCFFASCVELSQGWFDLFSPLNDTRWILGQSVARPSLSPASTQAHAPMTVWLLPLDFKLNVWNGRSVENTFQGYRNTARRTEMIPKWDNNRLGFYSRDTTSKQDWTRHEVYDEANIRLLTYLPSFLFLF